MNNVLGPRNVRGIFGETFKIIGRNLLSLLAIVASVQVPLWVAIFGIISILGIASQKPSIIGLIGVGLLVILAYAFLGGALIHAVSEQFVRQKVHIGRAYDFAWGRLWPLAGVSILISLFGSLVAMLSNIHPFLAVVCFCVAIYFMVHWACALQAVLLEALGPFKALSRSFALAQGNSWRILGFSSVVFMIFFVLSSVGKILLLLIAPTVAPTPSFTLLYMTFIFIPAFLIGGIAYTLLYYDLRVRKEGYNLESLAKELHIEIDNDSHEKNF
jgi:hypothetical protein